MLIHKLISLSIGVMLISCGSPNVAKDYNSKSGDERAADAKPVAMPDTGEADQPADDYQEEDGSDTGADDEAEDSAGEEEDPAGDVTRGNALLQNCAACHNSGGLAKNVTLNAAAISRLDAAFTGAQSGFHSVFPEAFEAPGRADLEAALKAIP